MISFFSFFAHISLSGYPLLLRSLLSTLKQICLHRLIPRILIAILWYHIWRHSARVSRLKFLVALLPIQKSKTKPRRYTRLGKTDTKLLTHRINSFASDGLLYFLYRQGHEWWVDICCRNNGILPLDTIPGNFCTRSDGLCSLDRFIQSQARASELANYQYAVSNMFLLMHRCFYLIHRFSASVIGLWTSWNLLRTEIYSHN